jgi:hypothetical protein
MDLAKPLVLVAYLRRRTLRTNIGVWFLPLSAAGVEADLAVRLGVESVDIAQYYRSTLDPRTEFARLSASRLFNTLDQIASTESFNDCVLIYHFDLLLAGLKEADRNQIWQDIYNRLPNRKRALLIAIPDTSIQLFPTEYLLKKLQDDYRIT